MACHRCQGLMIGCILDKDLHGWIWGWRCANCGFLVDPRIDRIRRESIHKSEPNGHGDEDDRFPIRTARGRRTIRLPE
jgi:hypothetical protein